MGTPTIQLLDWRDVAIKRITSSRMDIAPPRATHGVKVSSTTARPSPVPLGAPCYLGLEAVYVKRKHRDAANVPSFRNAKIRRVGLSVVLESGFVHQRRGLLTRTRELRLELIHAESMQSRLIADAVIRWPYSWISTRAVYAKGDIGVDGERGSTTVVVTLHTADVSQCCLVGSALYDLQPDVMGRRRPNPMMSPCISALALKRLAK